jgi:O-antigen ligase
VAWLQVCGSYLSWGQGRSHAAGLNSSRAEVNRPLTSILFFLSPLVTSAVPLLTWLFFPLIVIALVVPALRRGCEWRQLLPPNPALAAFLLLALYVFLNAAWAADRGAAFSKAAVLLGLILLTFTALTAIDRLDDRYLRTSALAFTAGAFLGALFVLIELLTNGGVMRMVMNSIALLQPHSTKHVATFQGEVTWVNPSYFNHNVAMLMFNLWPGLLVLRMIEAGARRAVFIGAFFLSVAIPVAISEHQSSQMALIASLLVLPLAWYWPKPVVRALAALWCLAFVLVLPFDFLAYKAELHMVPWLPSSFRARVIIWEYTAERVLDQPLLGIGAGSTPALKVLHSDPEQQKSFVYARDTGQHAHDLFLQTLYELGVVGAVLIAFAGAAVALRMSLLSIEAQPFAAATFAVFIAIAAFSWGMWQTWLMCAVGLLVLYTRTAASATQAAISDPAKSDSLDARASGLLLRHHEHGRPSGEKTEFYG